MNRFLFKKYIIKYLPLILAFVGLSVYVINLLIEIYIPAKFKELFYVITMISYILLYTLLGLVLKTLINNMSTDHLTGLHTRSHLYTKYVVEMNKNANKNNPVSLLMIDVDSFKQINDTYGHLAGDYVLKKISGILKKLLQTNATVIRWGGEEFIIMLMNSDAEHAGEIAENIRATIEKTKIIYENKIIHVTISIGTATTIHGSGLNELIKLADQSLYKAKETRNSVESTVTALSTMG